LLHGEEPESDPDASTDRRDLHAGRASGGVSGGDELEELFGDERRGGLETRGDDEEDGGCKR
jgi:hypothetical protein